MRANVDRLTKTLDKALESVNAERIQGRIGSGESFRMLLYKKVALSIQPQYGYAATYNAASQQITVDGFNDSTQKQYKNTTACQNLHDNGLNLWGRNFHFDGQNHLIDTQLGQYGIIYFDSDVGPKFPCRTY